MESYSGIPYSQILGVFANHQAQVLVVGGVAAHFYGASYNTKDLDLVYSRTPQNVERVMAALSEMNTLFRDLAGRKILPTTTHLLTATPKLLLTKHGPLDLYSDRRFSSRAAPITKASENRSGTYAVYLSTGSAASVREWGAQQKNAGCGRTLSMEEDDTGYESIVTDATHFDLNGLPVQVLSLPRLIAVKERLKRPADLIVLPILRAALERFSAPPTLGG
ncbi:MAG: hypothetical protein IPK82_22050 [Polyangiaceae bacterium]|nr:hypothetical protein [Polyangiaceae bacterium]